MIEQIPELPENVLGFTAKGAVTPDDYASVIIPAVESMLSRQGSVRMLYQLGEDFTGINAAAAWEDTKLGLKHLNRWEKLALVSDVEWIRWSLRVFGMAIPGHVRVFHNNELNDAKRWVSQ